MTDWVKKLGVVGGGAMGQGIAVQALVNGVPVILKEVDERLASNAHGQISHQVLVLCRRGDVDLSVQDFLETNFSTTTSPEDLRDCDLVIEAVPEKLDLKFEVFSDLDEVLPSDVVFASNTSTIPIYELKKSVFGERPLIGLHFFNPVPRMQLVEVIPGEADSSITELALDFVRQIDRTPIVVKDVPGFLVNRCLIPFMIEGFRVLEEWDVPFEQIDAAARESGYWPMGPFQLLDFVGIDVSHDAAKVIVGSHPDYTELPMLFRWMHLDGRYGRKAGNGFYQVPDDVMPLQERVNEAYANRLEGPNGMDAYVRMQAQFLREAVLAAQNGLTSQYRQIDEACKLALNIARGPLEEIRSVSPGLFLRTLDEFTERYGPRFSPPELLKRVVAQGSPGFYYDGGV